MAQIIEYGTHLSLYLLVVMQADIVNVVVIRFSLRVKEWQSRLFFDEKSRESWFRYRAELYRSTLGRSLSHQTLKPFRTYLLMDEGDRSLHEKYLGGLDFTPIFSDRNHFQIVADDLKRLGVVDNVAVTRVDSDDIVERLYFEKINSKIRELKDVGKKSALIATCCGYRTNFLEIQSAFHCAPPFITLFRESYKGENVYSHDHREISEMEHVIDTSAEWMQVIHGTNVSNKLKPSNADSLDKFKAGDMGSGFTQKRPIDSEWFKIWSGFDLPDSSLFARAPIATTRSRIRWLWRLLSGKI
ncbi:hypothetical protein [Azonexus sp.]|uniref:hypothetical protein n=1 Tax=Azonexus sp. TaxID=1872668 RepID=UPI0035AD8F0E